MERLTIAKLRKRHFSANLSLSYAEPLHIVRGQGQYLFDQEGKRYLDLVNNVAHVGHCHPKVVAAASQQLSILNTNTRYYDENLVSYAEALLKHFPKELSVVYFVNSGSEANDLAMRIARAVRDKKHQRHLQMRDQTHQQQQQQHHHFTQEDSMRRDSVHQVQEESPMSDEERAWYAELLGEVSGNHEANANSSRLNSKDNSTCSACRTSSIICLDHAYHGNTQSCIEISPYKFNGRGGKGRPPYVYIAKSPDIFRLKLSTISKRSNKSTIWSSQSVQEKEDEAPALYFAQDIEEIGKQIYYDHLNESRSQKQVRFSTDSAPDEEDLSQGQKCCDSCCAGCCGRPIAFIAESAPGCAGQIILPDGYLSAAFKKSRELGAVCIADEVQVGFGRSGSSMWAFQTQKDVYGSNDMLISEDETENKQEDEVSKEVKKDISGSSVDYVIPDIVTLGKPAGNGWPIGAVVTTPRMAQAFGQTGMEYFNTFGGSTASARVGRAVLDVIEEENLLEHAEQVGTQMLNALNERIASRFPFIIGDVRGLGLYIGVELIRWVPCSPLREITEKDNEMSEMQWEPAAEETSWVANKLVVDHRILISTDGPDHNVLKIKPPLCITTDDVNYFITSLGTVLDSLVKEFPWVLSASSIANVDTKSSL